jgi:hypothetical protein
MRAGQRKATAGVGHAKLDDNVLGPTAKSISVSSIYHCPRLRGTSMPCFFIDFIGLRVVDQK